jgi:hypothetical protein
MRLAELVAKFYDVVKVKGSECPDEWFSDMLYLNDQIVRANGTKRSDAEIIAHIVNVAPKCYNIPLSILSQSDIVTEKLKWRMVNSYGHTWLDIYYYGVSAGIT